MAVSTVSKARKNVPGKSRQSTITVVLSSTYVSGGEVLTARELGYRRLTKPPVCNLIAGNATEATPVTSAWAELESSGTKCKVHLQNGKTSAELAAGVTVANVKVELECTGY